MNPQKYEEIINHLSNSNNNIQNAKVESDKTWEAVLAELGDDYWGGENLYAYKVIEVLMPKIISAMSNFVGQGLDPNDIVLKGFNLNDGKVYFEFPNPLNSQTTIAWGDIGAWNESVISYYGNNLKYEDIVSHLSNPSIIIQNRTNYSVGTTWETVRAGLTDYYSVWNLSGYLAAQAE